MMNKMKLVVGISLCMVGLCSNANATDSTRNMLIPKNTAPRQLVTRISDDCEVAHGDMVYAEAKENPEGRWDKSIPNPSCRPGYVPVRTGGYVAGGHTSWIISDGNYALRTTGVSLSLYCCRLIQRWEAVRPTL